MFEVQSSFIKKRMTTKSSDRWSVLVREKTSSPYSNTGRHFVLIRWRTTSSEAARSTNLAKYWIRWTTEISYVLCRGFFITWRWNLCDSSKAWQTLLSLRFGCCVNCVSCVCCVLFSGLWRSLRALHWMETSLKNRFMLKPTKLVGKLKLTQ